MLKRAFLVDSATAFGLVLGWKLPTARPAIGSGKSDFVMNGIFSKDMGSIHMDANLNATRLGVRAAGSGRVQTGLSASFSLPVAEKWGLTAELSDTRRSGQADSAQLLLATAYSPTKRLPRCRLGQRPQGGIRGLGAVRRRGAAAGAPLVAAPATGKGSAEGGGRRLSRPPGRQKPFRSRRAARKLLSAM